jgi:hypothetical protein
MKEDFFSCQQYERETLLDLFRRFLHLKAKAERTHQILTSHTSMSIALTRRMWAIKKIGEKF